jgi:hypothetical protein
MYLDNKYTKIYYQLVERGLSRESGADSIYYEKHHIIPRSLGGSDDDDNLVYLLPREHYVAHHLLTKMVEGTEKSKMTFALHTFFHFNKYRRLNFTARQYEYHKKEFAKACKYRVPKTKSDVYSFKHRETLEEFVGTIYEFHKHSGLSQQEVNFLRVAAEDEASTTRWIKNWGVWVDELQDWSYNKRKKPSRQTPVICEHCNKSVSPGNYSRWHGDNCKEVDIDGHYARTRQVARISKR